MYSILNDIPSIPTIPSTEHLNFGITTRVMAKRHELQRERDKQDGYQYKDDIERRRRTSKFLTGARIPNSIIKLDALNSSIQDKGIKDTMLEHEDFVNRLIKRLQPLSQSNSNEFEDGRENLNIIKRELQKRSMHSALKDSTRDSLEEKKHVSINITAQEFDKTSKSSVKDRWQELKEKRRITRRTSILGPLNGEKLSTYESIRNAIENSKVIQQLLNVDHIEEEKMKEIQTSKSLLMLAVSKKDVTNKIFENNEIKTKEDAKTSSPTTDYRSSNQKTSNKRKYSSKSDRSNRLTPKKSAVPQKNIDYKKHSK
ncbi:hypothetical protein RN001_012216 [Aquatica leii]|uniref:Uncharacterized protein n=1 Tax=Aquatica leii TaxID=1421715 RepID=A0AAN7PSN0_9COLE|nr:hypothetical protein RN001_012216 [Aquatica leii]